jgi:hypothetical protein
LEFVPASLLVIEGEPMRDVELYPEHGMVFVGVSDRQEKLELKPEAVLHWSNPVRGGETNGSVFVWTYEGRAELVGTIFSHLARNDPQQKIVAHSFQSLSHQPLAGERPGQPGA